MHRLPFTIQPSAFRSLPSPSPISPLPPHRLPLPSLHHCRHPSPLLARCCCFRRSVYLSCIFCPRVRAAVDSPVQCIAYRRPFLLSFAAAVLSLLLLLVLPLPIPLSSLSLSRCSTRSPFLLVMTPPRAHGVNPRDARTRRHPADLQLLSTHPRTQTHRAPPPHLATEAEAFAQLRPPEGFRLSDRRGWNGEWKTALVAPCRRARVRSSASGEAVARLGDEARETQAGARAGRAGGRGAAPRFRGTDGFLLCFLVLYVRVCLLQSY